MRSGLRKCQPQLEVSGPPVGTHLCVHRALPQAPAYNFTQVTSVTPHSAPGPATDISQDSGSLRASVSTFVKWCCHSTVEGKSGGGEPDRAFGSQ